MSSIVASTMTKLPADQLALLRGDFNARPAGLTMHQFVSVMLRYSEGARQKVGKMGGKMGGARGKLEVDTGESEQEKVSTVGNLVELFHQIDVNGDDSMDWDEFTGFIINMAMAAAADVHFHDHWRARPDAGGPLTEARARVRDVAHVPALNRALICCGDRVSVVAPHPTSRTPADKGAGEFGGCTVVGRLFPAHAEPNDAYRGRLLRGEDVLECLQCAYAPALDLLITLTSDLRITFHKLVGSGGGTSESMKPAGRTPTSTQQ
jgi:hypothetical protein